MMLSHNPERERAIYYGLNDVGANDIVEYWGGSDEDTAEVLIPHDEFMRFWSTGIIDDLNDHYGVLIDDYEIDAIGGDLSYAFDLIAPKAKELPSIYSAVREAYERRTALLFRF